MVLAKASSGKRDEKTNLQNAVFCEESLEKDHALYVHLTYKVVDYLRNLVGPQSHFLKTCQIIKVQASSHEITNEPCTSTCSSNYETYDF